MSEFALRLSHPCQIGGTEIVVHTLMYCAYGNKPLLTFGLLMYISYFVLFSKLFYENYCAGPKKHTKKD